MRIDRERLTTTKVFPLGAITLSVTAGEYPQQITREVTFLVVDCSSTYNAILGRTHSQFLEGGDLNIPLDD